MLAAAIPLRVEIRLGIVVRGRILYDLQEVAALEVSPMARTTQQGLLKAVKWSLEDSHESYRYWHYWARRRLPGGTAAGKGVYGVWHLPSNQFCQFLAYRGAWVLKRIPNLHLVEYDLTDLSASIRLLQTTNATEVYNLAAQSFVGVSFDQPLTTGDITGHGLCESFGSDPYR
jgi:hypothetical protein